MTKKQQSEMVKSHWEYVKAVLDHEVPDGHMITKEQYIQKVGFHYMSAFVHGIKHGKEQQHGS